MSAIDIVLVVIALVAVGVAVACALQLKSLRAELRERGDSSAETLAALEQANNALDALNVALAETRRTANAIAQQQTTDAAVEQQRYLTIAREFSQAGDRMDDLRRETAQQLGANREGIEQRLDKVRETVDAQLGAIRKDNNVQLDQMRATVDEKLSRTLNDRLSASFKQVSDQLEAVYKGLGDMQSIATGVGDLKRVLGNVKARGILGEVQLGAILADILTPDQYLENVATKPGASERVEFAVKLPVDEGDPVLLPIDSKFPMEDCVRLCDAAGRADRDGVEAARKALDKAYQEMLACLLEETVLDPARDDAETLARIQASFACGCADDTAGAAEINARFEQDNYLCDTHTAVAFCVAETVRSAAPMVVLSTASPYKFPRDVLAALGETAPESDFAAMAALNVKTGCPVPASLSVLNTLPVRFNTVIEPAAIRDAALK